MAAQRRLSQDKQEKTLLMDAEEIIKKAIDHEALALETFLKARLESIDPSQWDKVRLVKQQEFRHDVIHVTWRVEVDDGL